MRVWHASMYVMQCGVAAWNNKLEVTRDVRWCGGMRPCTCTYIYMYMHMVMLCMHICVWDMQCMHVVRCAHASVQRTHGCTCVICLCDAMAAWMQWMSCIHVVQCNNLYYFVAWIDVTWCEASLACMPSRYACTSVCIQRMFVLNACHAWLRFMRAM